MSEVLVERRGAVALLTLNSPNVLNALSVSMASALTEALEAQARASEVRVIVITGEGRAFSSGGDIAFMKKVVDQGGRFLRRIGHLSPANRRRRRSISGCRSGVRGARSAVRGTEAGQAGPCAGFLPSSERVASSRSPRSTSRSAG